MKAPRLFRNLWISMAACLVLASGESHAATFLPYTATENGYYSVVISGTDGQIVRRLMAREKLTNGQALDAWDGLDDAGKPAPPGGYLFRGLHHQGIGLKYLLTYNNPGNPPWRTADGTGEWGGDHSSPQAVAADAKGVYLGWPAAEDGYGVIGCDLAGRRRWGYFMTPYPTSCGSAFLASDSRYLYFLSDVWTKPKEGQTALACVETIVSCLDQETGYLSQFSAAKPYTAVGAFDSGQVETAWWWDLWRTKNFSLDTYALHDDYWYTGRCMGGNAAGLAARDGKLYLSLRVPQQVVICNAADMREIARWPLPKPGGLAVDAKGSLFAISGTSVVRLDPATGKTEPVIRSGLEAPVGLALSAQGELYVSDWGAAQCVKVFSASGKPLRTIGTPGGRPWLGKYDPNGMLLPRGIALDSEGKLWVAEDDSQPRRVSVWNAKDGRFLKEYIGGTNYGATQGGLVDPKDGRHAISQGVLFGMDEKNGTSHPEASLWRRTSRDAIFRFGPAQAGATATNRIIDYNGRRYLVCEALNSLVIGEYREASWIPRAAIGGISTRKDDPFTLPENQLKWRQTIAPAWFASHAGENFIWTDLNSDGIPQPEEMQWQKQTPEFPCLGLMWGPGGLSGDLSAWIGGNTKGGVIARFGFQGWTENGAPKYDFDHAALVALLPNGLSGLGVNSKGETFSVTNAERKRPGFQPTLTARNPEGKVLWEYATSVDHRPMGAINGEAILGPLDAGGEAGEILSLTQWHGCYVPLITTDGIFIDRLLRDPSEGGEPGPDLYRGETVQYLNRLDNGRILLSHGKNAHHLMEVTGLETLRRFEGRVLLTPAMAAQAMEQLSRAQSEVIAAALIRITPRTVPVTVDGNLDEWDWSKAASIGKQDAVLHGEIALASSAQELYLAYKIAKKGGFHNLGKEASQLFLSGDAVDLQFNSDPAADPKRSDLAIGDTRLLISKLDEKPVAVVFKAKVPFAKSPVVFRSPVRGVTFDEVTVIDRARVVITDTAEGYTVEAAIPLEAVGLGKRATTSALWPGRVLPGDAGFIVGDATGQRVARIYRFNPETRQIADVPTEAALTPARWGGLEVERLSPQK